MGENCIEEIFVVESYFHIIDVGTAMLLTRDKLEYMENRRCTFCGLKEETHRNIYFSNVNSVNFGEGLGCGFT